MVFLMVFDSRLFLTYCFVGVIYFHLSSSGNNSPAWLNEASVLSGAFLFDRRINAECYR
jgi:hypothetical protein